MGDTMQPRTKARMTFSHAERAEERRGNLFPHPRAFRVKSCWPARDDDDHIDPPRAGLAGGWAKGWGWRGLAGAALVIQFLLPFTAAGQDTATGPGEDPEALLYGLWTASAGQDTVYHHYGINGTVTVPSCDRMAPAKC